MINIFLAFICVFTLLLQQPERLNPETAREPYDVRSDVWAYGWVWCYLSSLKKKKNIFLTISFPFCQINSGGTGNFGLSLSWRKCVPAPDGDRERLAIVCMCVCVGVCVCVCMCVCVCVCVCNLLLIFFHKPSQQRPPSFHLRRWWTLLPRACEFHSIVVRLSKITDFFSPFFFSYLSQRVVFFYLLSFSFVFLLSFFFFIFSLIVILCEKKPLQLAKGQENETQIRPKPGSQP